MRIMPLLTAILILAGVSTAADQRPVPPHQREVPAKPPAARAAARPSDAQLESAIRAKFAKSKISADKFTIHVQGGVATIEGRTDVIQHKGTATRMAKTAGAVAVNNHVQISDAAREKAAGNLEKGRRRVQVKRSDARSDSRQSRE
jgi:hypothetical protein